MTDRDNGGPAFPIHPDMPLALGCTPSVSDAGMTLRDWFAGQAINGMLSNVRMFDAQGCAKMAYKVADCMLEWRK